MTRTALLIEDNEQNRYLATFLLERHGYRVVAAADGRAALSALQGFTPDVVLLDIQLPGMDGYEVARRLRELDSLRATPHRCGNVLRDARGSREVAGGRVQRLHREAHRSGYVHSRD